MSAFRKSGLEISRSRRGVSGGPDQHRPGRARGVATPPSATGTVSGPGRGAGPDLDGRSWPRSVDDVADQGGAVAPRGRSAGG